MTDAEKLRRLALWFDLLDEALDYCTEPEIQNDLRRIADMLGGADDSENLDRNADGTAYGGGSFIAENISNAEIKILPVRKRSGGVCFVCRKWVEDCKCVKCAG